MVILFRSETWVMTPHMGWALGIFQNRVFRHLTERYTQRLWGGSLEYPSLDEVTEEKMWEVGLEVVEAYVLRRKNKVMGTVEVRLRSGTGRGAIRGDS